MGIERLCLWLGALLVLPILDARTVKLVPTETKTLTTDEGVTHEISRYLVMPDDETSNPNADTVTGEKFKITIIPPDVKNSSVNEEFNESKQLKNINESGESNDINVKFIRTGGTKTPSLVKVLKFKNSSQGMADTKVTKTVIPHHESKTTVYIRQDGYGESNPSQIKDGIKLNAKEESLKAGAENALRGIAEHGTLRKTLDEHNNIEHVNTKTNLDPTKITNIKYTEMPIKWDFLKTVGNEKANHALLTSIGINKTFTLPGKRGRFKLIHEDDDDEYSRLETPQLEHTISIPTFSYNNMGHLVDKSENIPDDVDENNERSLKLLNIENINQHSDIIPNQDKFDLKTDAENNDLLIRSLKNTNEKANTTSDSETSVVKLTFEKPNPIIRPSSESAVEMIHSGSTKEFVKTDADSWENNPYRSRLMQVLNTDNSVAESKFATENINKKSTLHPIKVVNISVEKSVTLPILNQSKEDSSDVSKSYIVKDEPKFEKTELPIHSKNIKTNANISHKNHNNLQVLPLEIKPVKTFNTTSTKTTNIIVSHSSHVVPGNNKMRERLNQSDEELPEHDTHQIKIPLGMDNTSTKTTFVAGSGSTHFNKKKSISTVKTTNTKTTIRNKVTHTNSFGSHEIKKTPSNIDLPLSKTVFSYDSIEPTQNLLNVIDYSGSENKYKKDTKNDAESKIVSREDNLRTTTGYSPTKKNDTTRVILNHEIVTMSEVNNADSNTNSVSKTKNDHSSKQDFIHTNEAEFNKDDVTNPSNIGMKLQSRQQTPTNDTNILPDLIEKKYKADATIIAEPIIVSSEDNLGVITGSLPKEKNIVETSRVIPKPIIRVSDVNDANSNTNTVLKTENDHSKTQDFIHATNKAKQNIDDIRNPHNMNVQSAFEDEKQETPNNHINILLDIRNEKHNMDPDTKTLPQTNIDDDQVSLPLDEIEQLIEEHNKYNQTKLTDQIKNLTFESNNNNENINILPTQAKFLSTDKKENNLMHLEQFENDENVSAPETMPSGVNYDVLPMSEKSLNEEELEQSNHVTNRDETSHSHSELCENNKNKNEEYGNEASVKTSPIDQKYTNEADTSYPVHTYNSYVRYNPYQDHDTETNHKNSENVQSTSTEFINNQYLENLRKYLISSAILAELKQKYHEPNAMQNVWIKEHLKNSGVLDKLRKEQLLYLTPVKEHQTTGQNVKHNVIYDLPTVPNFVELRNQNHVPTYVATYQNARLLQDNADLQHYLPNDFDANTIKDAMNDLGVRVMNIITYLKNLRVPDFEIIHFIIEAKAQLITEALGSFAKEFQTKVYNSLSQRLEKIAKDILQRYKSSYESKNIVIPSTCY